MKKSRAKDDKLTFATMEIPIVDLRPGMDLAGGHLVAMKEGEVRATKKIRVKDIDECEGQWRSHIHVNKTQCYDMRHSIVRVIID